jgi:hypothetical protein
MLRNIVFPAKTDGSEGSGRERRRSLVKNYVNESSATVAPVLVAERFNKAITTIGLVTRAQERDDPSCSAKTPYRPISLDFRVPNLHAPGMKTLLMFVVVPILNLVVFGFNRVASVHHYGDLESKAHPLQRD